MKAKIRFLYAFLSISVGFLIPIVFAILDLWELNIEVSLENIFVVTKSHKIHSFGFVLFPLIMGLFGFLFYKINYQNKKLAEESEYLNTVLNAAPDAIIFFNDKLEVAFANLEFNKLGIEIKDFILKANLSFLIDQGLEINNRELNLVSSHSAEHPFLLNFRPTTYKDESNYFISLKDMKGIREKEAIIEEQRKQMIEKTKLASLGEMAAGIAHEINNPLMVICGNNSLIQKMQDKDLLDQEKTLKLTGTIDKQVSRITDIITALRNLSRGMSNDEKEVFSIKSIIHEAMNLAKIKSGFQPIEFFNEVDKMQEEFNIYAHQGQVVQVVLNLIGNAIDAIGNHEEPWVKIEAEKINNKEVTVYISDSGKGIEQEIVNKIFQPLFTTKEIGKGTGLGLSLSKSFMQQNGGNLTYMTRDDHTCFMLTFEIAQENLNISA